MVQRNGLLVLFVGIGKGSGIAAVLVVAVHAASAAVVPGGRMAGNSTPPETVRVLEAVVVGTTDDNNIRILRILMCFTKPMRLLKRAPRQRHPDLDQYKPSQSNRHKHQRPLQITPCAAVV